MAAKQTTSTAATIASMAAMLRAEAAKANAQYPQYDGYWDGWRVAEIIKTIRTKRGVAFTKGDLVLVSPDTNTEKTPPRTGNVDYANWPEVEYTTAYSRTNGCNTMVRVTEVREIVVVG